MENDAPLVIAEEGSSGVWTFTLNSPANRNAMGPALAAALTEAMQNALASEAKAVFLQAAGPVFCAGADLKAPPDSTAVPEILGLVSESPIPWVVCVDAPAVGAGAILAGLAVVTIAGEAAWFLMPEIDNVGRFPIGVRWLT